MKLIHVFQEENINTTVKVLATIKNLLMILTKKGCTELKNYNVLHVKYNKKESLFYIDKKKLFTKV